MEWEAKSQVVVTNIQTMTTERHSIPVKSTELQNKIRSTVELG